MPGLEQGLGFRFVCLGVYHVSASEEVVWLGGYGLGV